ncbi:MAG: YchJ family metal-binding protein [Idiomarina sp.]
MNQTDPCPCGSEQDYQSCCAPYHEQRTRPDTPEALMRSRYSAFYLQLTDYLLSTWHASTRPAQLDLSDAPQWVKLQVISASQKENKGSVHFRAFYKQAGDLQFMEEKSAFVQEQGQWFYLQGRVS